MQLLEFIGNHLFLSSLMLSLVTLLLWDIRRGIATGAKLLGPMEMTTLLNREQALLLDLRGEQDYTAGHIPNARSLPAEELDGRLATLHKHRAQPLILYCRNGSESGKRGRLLRDNGFEQVYALRGGLQEWQHANLPLHTK